MLQTDSTVIQDDRSPTGVAEHDLPPDFVRRMRHLLREEADPFLASLGAPAQGLRVNTLRLDPARFRGISPFELEALPFPEGGFRLVGGPRAGKHPFHAAGLYYLQDPGAMAVGALLDPRPGERVIDLAAAPGGKATHLAALMRGQGVLIANDVHPVRARELAGNLERMGVVNAVVTCDPVDRLADRFGAVFDRVLLDAPCSGESMFHKSEAARAEWSSAAVQGCARRQGELLEAAARLVRPGGLLVYSTCTFSPEENEGAVSDLLDARPDFQVAQLADVPGGSGGRPDWLADRPARPETAGALRLWPHRVAGAGHFVVGLRREEGDEPEVRPLRAQPLPRGALALVEDFMSLQGRSGLLRNGNPTGVGEEVYLAPAGAPALDGLHPVRTGLWLGTLRKDRFEPAHALAMAAGDASHVQALALHLGQPEVEAYLRGEAVRAPGAAGWVRVLVDGYPLGWGKRVGEVVKNHYPKGLRWR